jgi:hypothetical protein
MDGKSSTNDAGTFMQRWLAALPYSDTGALKQHGSVNAVLLYIHQP